ncbi:hypothetical protein KIL84_000535 [Mauremys mutica]|uniref:Uncharacterized protein n=1 Tax=Mauremys mutica TaxID=74926 RepID=A0A9D3WZ07_9SAUR|nr:hypothetical protein KIL84_000535 [Mauremys mutica]
MIQAETGRLAAGERGGKKLNACVVRLESQPVGVMGKVAWLDRVCQAKVPSPHACSQIPSHAKTFPGPALKHIGLPSQNRGALQRLGTTGNQVQRDCTGVTKKRIWLNLSMFSTTYRSFFGYWSQQSHILQKAPLPPHHTQ